MVQHLGLALLQGGYQKGVGVADGSIINNQSCFQGHIVLLHLSLKATILLKQTTSLLQRYSKLSLI